MATTEFKQAPDMIQSPDGFDWRIGDPVGTKYEAMGQVWEVRLYEGKPLRIESDQCSYWISANWGDRKRPFATGQRRHCTTFAEAAAWAVEDHARKVAEYRDFLTRYGG